MNLFSLKSDDVINLGAKRAVVFFRELLWAESSRVKIGRQLISVPDCINVGDGGLDALVENANPSSEDLIPKGTSGFQIKSGDLSPKECKKELHSKKDLEESLQPGIKRVLDDKGTYILVLFAELTDPKIQSRENAILEDLKKNGYSNPKIRLYTANKIIGIAERFPALIAKLKHPLFECIPYETWSEDINISTPKRFIEDEIRTKIIEEIREKLRDNDGEAVFIRITGLLGVGKKRLAHESLTTFDLKNSVIYVRSEGFINSSLFNYISIDNTLNVIIVIDDCSIDNHNYFHNRMGNKGSRISIITISDDIDIDIKKPFQYLLEKLSVENIKVILSKSHKNLPIYLVQRFSEFSEGFPRLALNLAERYGENPSEYSNVIELTDRSLLDKFIAGNMDVNSSKFKKVKKILMGIALFKKVGYKDRLLSQAKWVCSNISKLEWEEFQSIVKEQRDRGLIEGNYYLRVTPFLLESYLYCEWWETYGNFENIQEFRDLIEGFPVNLDVYFFDTFFYDVIISRLNLINHTIPGKSLIKKILSSGSILAEKEIFNQKKYIKLICNLVESNIELGIIFLKNVLNSWSNEDLNQFIDGRNELLFLLEKLAFRENYFEEAALLLLRLAETHSLRQPIEKSNHLLNNANEFYAKIFSPVWGETPPGKKFDFLTKIFKKSSTSRKSVILQGFWRAFTTNFKDNWAGSLGNLPPPNIWNGEWEEIYNYYKKNWNFLCQVVKNKEEELRLEILEIFISHSRWLLKLNNLEINDMIRQSFVEFNNFIWIDKVKLLKKVSTIIRFEGKDFTDDILTL